MHEKNGKNMDKFKKLCTANMASNGWVGAVNQGRCLLGDGFAERWMAVTNATCGNAGAEIEIAGALIIP